MGNFIEPEVNTGPRNQTAHTSTKIRLPGICFALGLLAFWIFEGLTTRGHLLFWGLYTRFQDFRDLTSAFRGFKDFWTYSRDSRSLKDFKDTECFMGFRPDFKAFWSGSMEFMPILGISDRISRFLGQFPGISRRSSGNAGFKIFQIGF